LGKSDQRIILHNEQFYLTKKGETGEENISHLICYLKAVFHLCESDRVGSERNPRTYDQLGLHWTT